MPTKARPTDLNKLSDLVLAVMHGKVSQREAHKTFRKEIVRAKRQLDVDREIQLRLMMGKLEPYGPMRTHATKQYLTVLRKRPDCADAMKEMADLFPPARRIEWLERAAEICERHGDYAEQLNALDHMLWPAPRKDAAAAIYERMRAILDRSPDTQAYSTIGSQALLEEGRGAETVDYLEALLAHMLRRRCTWGWPRMAALPLVAAYSQCGMTAGEAKAKLVQFRELCPDEDTVDCFDHVMQTAFLPQQYFSLEAYGMKLEWFPVP